MCNGYFAQRVYFVKTNLHYSKATPLSMKGELALDQLLCTI